MYNSNLAYKIDNTEVPECDYFVNEILNIFNLSDEETKKLAENNTVKLIVAVPFVAQCCWPERTALAHLCLYVAEIKELQKCCLQSVC